MSNNEIIDLEEKLNILRSSENTREVAKNIVDTLNNISSAYRNTDPDKTEQFAKEALEIALKSEYFRGMGNSYNNLGVSFWARGDFYKALEQFDSCLKINKKIDNKMRLVSTSLNIGLMHTELGDYTKAFEYYFKCVDLSEDNTEYERILAITFLNIGVAYERMDDKNRAMEFYFKALKLHKKLDNLSSVGRIHANIANIYLDQGDLSKSLEYVNLSLNIANKTNDNSDIAHSYLLLGLIHEKKGNYQKSLSFLLKSRDLVEKIGEQHNIIYAYYGLSNVYEKLEEYVKAFEYLERGIEISRNIGAKHTEIEGYKSLAEFYEGRSKLESSLKYYKKYWKLKSEISGKAATDKIAHLQVAHQIEKKEKMAEIHRLKNVELVKEIQERKEAERHLRESEEKFRKLSIEDPLTGLFNRRYFFDKTERILERSKKESNEVYVSIIDIDYFKHVNDEYGHLAGDFVLRELGATINEIIRPSDMLARYGGEEFVLSLSNSSHKQVNELMERVRLAIESHDFLFEDKTINITISAGIACLSELEHSDKPLDKLIKIADKRLYRAKESGRNKVVGSE